MPATRQRPVQRDRGIRPQSNARPFVMGDVRKRSLILMIVTGFVLTVFAGRLVDLQVIQGQQLASAALDQRLRTTPITPPRGAILDSAGQPLALTVKAYNITADQTLIESPMEVAQALAPVLNEDVTYLANRLTGDRRFVYVAKTLTPETKDRVTELGLPGLFAEPTTRRVYPAADIAANVVGFVGGEGKGLGGIEYAFDAELTGVPGSQTYENGPGGRVIPTGSIERVEAVPGSDITLTIDRDIQFVAQRAISDVVKNAQAVSGTIVVQDPRTGQILAMATAPTFDANEPGLADEKDRGNRIITDAFEPGSTSKVITLAAVVNEGAATPLTPIKVPGGLERGDKVFKDHTPHGTLHLTLAGVMAQSSNIGTILAAEKIGGRKLSEYLERFGVAQPTGLGLPAENKGSVPAYENWSPTSMPTIAFGQGLSMNAIQATSVFSTIANDGVRVQPTLVAAMTDASGVSQPLPEGEKTRVVSKEAARQVRQMLEAVVGEGGTAPQAKIPGYRVGGKTGTAQYVDPACGCYNGEVIASFIGMAPADDPQLVVSVFVDRPRNGRYGGQLGAPAFKEVMTYALQARQIPPTGVKSPRLPIFSKK